MRDIARIVEYSKPHNVKLGHFRKNMNRFILGSLSTKISSRRKMKKVVHWWKKYDKVHKQFLGDFGLD